MIYVCPRLDRAVTKLCEPCDCGMVISAPMTQPERKVEEILQRLHEDQIYDYLRLHTPDLAAPFQAILQALTASEKRASAAEFKLADDQYWKLKAERALEALKPFADILLVRDQYGPAREDMIDGPDLSITPSDVRAARAALASWETK